MPSSRRRTLDYRIVTSTSFLMALATILSSSSIAHSREQLANCLPNEQNLPTDADCFIPITGANNLPMWQGLPDQWRAAHGVLEGRHSLESAKQTFLVFPFVVRDFELHLKYKFVSPEGNSGIQFRSKIVDEKTYRVQGYQADLDASGNFDGSMYEEGGRGSLSARGEKTTWDAQNKRTSRPLADDPEHFKVTKVGDWNEVVLVAVGNRMTYTINGRLMTELVDESPNAAAEGIIALQLHEGIAMDVQFKDGKIKILDNSRPK